MTEHRVFGVPFLLAAYTLGVWVWIGGPRWSIISTIAVFAYGASIGWNKSDLIDAAVTSIHRVGRAGFNGWVVFLALYGAAAAYPALFGYLDIHSYAPSNGSLTRASGVLAMWIGGLVIEGARVVYTEWRRTPSDVI